MGREDTHPHFHHEAGNSGYLVLCFCDFLVSEATSPAIQAVLSAALVSVQEMISHSTWVTMQQVKSQASGCNSEFLVFSQVLIWLHVICRFFFIII